MWETCKDYTLSRRAFVERCARSAFGLSILPVAELFARTAQAADTTGQSKNSKAKKATSADPIPSSGPGFGSAQRVIFLMLNGGMSHIDTLDPKTGASQGPAKPIPTKGDFQVTEYLPKLASVADKLCVIRSMTARIAVHVPARYYMRTAFEARNTIRHPMLGAWAQKLLGPSHATLPSSVCVNMPAEAGNGFLPSGFSPLPILDPDAGLQHARPSVSDDKFAKRLAVLDALDADFRRGNHDINVRAYSEFYDDTLRLMRGSDIRAFDLSAEPAKLRDDYGRTKFGQGCLLARRLTEAGVRFVEVVSEEWDMHNNLPENMEERAGEFDQAFAALINDLAGRGRLADTLVVVATEFGRSPRWTGTGRGHHPIAFSTVLAGAAVKPGRTYGASTADGSDVADRPMTVGEFHASIGWAMGLPLGKEILAPNGRPFTVGDKSKPALDLF